MRLLASASEGFDPARSWEELGQEPAEASPLFRMMSARRRSPHTGRVATFTRLVCPEWVNVIAVTDARELLVVEQFRHGSNHSTLEVVGGVVDPGEAPAEAARRELLEETGHEAKAWVALGSSAPNPAVQDNRCHFFLALECRPVAPLDLDPSEELRVWAFTWREWESRLRTGEIEHALVLNAFLRLEYWDGWPKLRDCLLGS